MHANGTRKTSYLCCVRINGKFENLPIKVFMEPFLNTHLPVSYEGKQLSIKINLLS